MVSWLLLGQLGIVYSRSVVPSLFYPVGWIGPVGLWPEHDPVMFVVGKRGQAPGWPHGAREFRQWRRNVVGINCHLSSAAKFSNL